MMRKKNVIRRAASSVRRAVSRIVHRKHEDGLKPVVHAPKPARIQQHARPKRLQSDIPLEQLDGAYTPTQTSLKASFRANGADRHRDQEFARGAGYERWNDEDRFTNKSGDPRIGTHGRTYEPGEKRRAK